MVHLYDCAILYLLVTPSVFRAELTTDLVTVSAGNKFVAIVLRNASDQTWAMRLQLNNIPTLSFIIWLPKVFQAK